MANTYQDDIEIDRTNYWKRRAMLLESMILRFLSGDMSKLELDLSARKIMEIKV